MNVNVDEGVAVVYSPEAAESFAQLVGRMGAGGYVVELTLASGEVLDAELIGPAIGIDDYYAVQFRAFDEEAGAAVGPVREAVTRKVVVY